jgi:hypothetical protein
MYVCGGSGLLSRRPRWPATRGAGSLPADFGHSFIRRFVLSRSLLRLADGHSRLPSTKPTLKWWASLARRKGPGRAWLPLEMTIYPRLGDCRAGATSHQALALGGTLDQDRGFGGCSFSSQPPQGRGRSWFRCVTIVLSRKPVHWPRSRGSMQTTQSNRRE